MKTTASKNFKKAGVTALVLVGISGFFFLLSSTAVGDFLATSLLPKPIDTLLMAFAFLFIFVGAPIGIAYFCIQLVVGVWNYSRGSLSSEDSVQSGQTSVPISPADKQMMWMLYIPLSFIVSLYFLPGLIASLLCPHFKASCSAISGIISPLYADPHAPFSVVFLSPLYGGAIFMFFFISWLWLTKRIFFTKK
jgi:hypothetical protein